MKRIVAFILTLALLVSVPVLSFAEIRVKNGKPDGTITLDLKYPNSKYTQTIDDFLTIFRDLYGVWVDILNNNEFEDDDIAPILIPYVSQFEFKSGQWLTELKMNGIEYAFSVKTSEAQNIKSQLCSAEVSVSRDADTTTQTYIFFALISSLNRKLIDEREGIIVELFNKLNVEEGIYESETTCGGIRWSLNWDINAKDLFSLRGDIIELEPFEAVSTPEPTINMEYYNESVERILQGGERLQDSSNSGGLVRPGSKSGTVTLGEKNALASAKNYLSTIMPFSYQSLIEQLEYEGYTHSEAVYAANNCGEDWYKQAEKCAKWYLNVMPMSRAELKEQLLYEGFTQAQAEYGVTQAGY